MKIFNKESKTNPEEDTQTGADSFEARNSGWSAEEANEPAETPKQAPVESGAKKGADAACREENEILKDQLFRLAADFDNFRKRIVRQMEENRKSAIEQILLDFVEVTDNFDRALKSARTAEDMHSIVNGIEQLSKQFFSILEKYGLERIECEKGGEFDPHRHEAVQHVDTSEVPDNTIVEVYRPGYALDSKVVRPAMVSVARTPDEVEK
jgi:molecular chaperone GrpE